MTEFLLTETGNRLVQETGFAVLIEVPVIQAPWIDLDAGTPGPWQTPVPPSPIPWISVNPTGSGWIEITPA